MLRQRGSDLEKIFHRDVIFRSARISRPFQCFISARDPSGIVVASFLLSWDFVFRVV